MRVLIIDNNDSFTYNLKHYVAQFINDIEVIRGDRLKLDAVANFDRIILSPGPGLPSEHPILEQVLAKYKILKPILGICLGQQAIAMHFGAELENLKAVKHGVSSKLNHFNNCTIFKGLPATFNVAHYHSWAVKKENFPEELLITSENEEGIITSIAHKEYSITALQFHPESILTEHGLQLIKNWLYS